MDPPRGTKGGGAARWGPVLFWLRYYHMFWFVAWIREPRTSVVAATTITMAARIAAPENDPEPSSIASPNLLSLPHRTRAGPELFFLFPFLDINHLLVWALWGCGRRDRVVQAQRQIHRALGKTGIIKPSRHPSCRWTDRPAPLRVAAHRLGRGRRVTLAARQRS